MTDKHFDLAIAGELNPDLILYGLPLVLPTERDVVGTGFTATLGSSSAIVAHNASKLGLKVQFSTLVGDDHFGAFTLDRLREAGVDTLGAIVDPARATGVSINLPHGAERHSLSYLGTIAELRVADLDIARLSQARHFHLCSLYLQTNLHHGLAAMLETLKASGMTLSLDTNDDPDDKWGWPLQEILPLLDLFMPSAGELCRMAGGVSLERAIDIFGEKVPALVVKRGREGCRVKQDDEVFDVPGLEVEPVDTIGAGDSFNAGFLAAYLRGKSLRACARAGNITGALSTLSAGGTEAFRDETLRLDFLERHGFFG